MEWLAENEIPFSIIFTKSDKIGKNVLSKNTVKFKARNVKGMGVSSRNLHNIIC